MTDHTTPPPPGESTAGVVTLRMAEPTGLRRGHLADLEVVEAILLSDPRQRASAYDASPRDMAEAVRNMIEDTDLHNPGSLTPFSQVHHDGPDLENRDTPTKRRRSPMRDYQPGIGRRIWLVFAILLFLFGVALIASALWPSGANAARATINNPPRVIRENIKSGEFERTRAARHPHLLGGWSTNGGTLITQEFAITVDVATPAGVATVSGGKRTKCKRFIQQKKFESSPFGTDLGKARINQLWCYVPGGAITYLPKASLSAWVTDGGGLSQWDFLGFENRSRYWVPFNGHAKGAHTDKVTAHFRQDLGPYHDNDYLNLKATVRSNGTAN